MKSLASTFFILNYYVFLHCDKMENEHMLSHIILQ